MLTHVIADIHGCRNEFEDLLEKLNPDLIMDRMVFTGDMIDRGPDSHGVVRCIKGMQQAYGKEHAIVLRGNHEQMMMDAASGFSGNWLCNGGNQTKVSYRSAQAAWKDDAAFFASLPLFYEDEHAICVHAGLLPGIPVRRQDPEDLLWIRESFYRHPGVWDKLIVFGHTPTLFINNEAFPWVHGKLVGIDTGCAYGGALTAITLSEGRIINIVQVESSKSHSYAS